MQIPDNMNREVTVSMGVDDDDDDDDVDDSISSSSDSSWDINCISEISRQKFEDGAIKRGANDASATASSWIDFADDDDKTILKRCKVIMAVLNKTPSHKRSFGQSIQGFSACEKRCYNSGIIPTWKSYNGLQNRMDLCKT